MITFNCDRCKQFKDADEVNILIVSMRKYELCDNCFNSALGVIELFMEQGKPKVEV